MNLLDIYLDTAFEFSSYVSFNSFHRTKLRIYIGENKYNNEELKGQNTIKLKHYSTCTITK